MPIGKSKGPLWYSVFPTAWGPMGAVGGTAGIVRIVLPHYPADDLAQLLAWEYSGAIRDEERFASLAEACRRYFQGEAEDFAEIPLVLPAEETFAGKVYRACRKIPFGQTKSYRELALAIGQAEAARATATLLSRNPLPLAVPCHRVIHADGRTGGFSAAGGPELKQRLLQHEKKHAGDPNRRA